MQAPEGKREGELFSAVRHIMQSSPQKLALSQLSGSRDMSMLLAQSAVSARPHAWSVCRMYGQARCALLQLCSGTAHHAPLPMIQQQTRSAIKIDSCATLDQQGKGRIHTQTAPIWAQPGIASVYSSIVQQTRSGVEFYIRAFPDLEGLTYGAARRAFPVGIDSLPALNDVQWPLPSRVQPLLHQQKRCKGTSSVPTQVNGMATYLGPDTELEFLHSFKLGAAVQGPCRALNGGTCECKL